MLTPDREQEARERADEALRNGDYHMFISPTRLSELFAEIDKLRTENEEWRSKYILARKSGYAEGVEECDLLSEKLKVAEEALDFAMRNSLMCGHDDPSWCEPPCRVVWKAKEALKTIRDKESS